MSIQAVAWVLDQSQSRGFSRLVLISLANHANKETGECWPAIRTLAKEAGVSKSAVAKHVGELVALGELEVVDEGGARRSAHYRLTFPAYVHETDEKGVDLSTTRTQRPRNGVDRTVMNLKTLSNESGESLFEAFFEFWTRKPYTSTVALTRSERGRINAAVKEARLARITAEDVKRRGVEYRILWPKLEATPQALLANWSRFEPAPSVEPCGECGDRGVVWSDGDGNRVAWDAVDAEHAVKCPACARRAG